MMIYSRKSGELLKVITSHKLNDTTFEDLGNRLENFRKWLNDYRDTIYESAVQVSIHNIYCTVFKYSST